jgi:hypothetical protein
MDGFGYCGYDGYVENDVFVNYDSCYCYDDVLDYNYLHVQNG